MIQILPWSQSNSVSEWEIDRQEKALFLESHPEYQTYVLVNSFDPLFHKNLFELLGDHQSISLLRLEELYESAEEKGYEDIVWLDDLTQGIEWVDHLDDPYPYDLNITLKKFQLQGFNFTKELDSSVINWSTGAGKSVYGVIRANYLLKSGKVDKVVVASKNHNKINWQRQFLDKANLVAEVAEATGKDTATKRSKRADIYQDSTIFIVNYEKFRFRTKNSTEPPVEGKIEVKKRPDSGDGKEILAALKGKNVFWIWDEMPSKMKNTTTGHFRGVQKIMKKTKTNYQSMLSAKKVESDPENVYSCFRILDPSMWSNKEKFRKEYAKSFSTFSPWQVASWDTVRLRELGMKISHMTHVANKYTDPAIRAEFPEEHWEDVIIDMSDQDQKLYDLTRNSIMADLSQEMNTFLTKMSVLQTICNNPAMVNNSKGDLAKYLASRHSFTDKNCTKLEKLHDMLDEIDGKVVLFSMFNDLGARMLVPYLVQWGHKFVLYDGKSKQDAEDRFRSNPDIKIFLSSDQGSDSINLEKATTVINYDLPWNYSTLEQRVNRINRLTSEADHVFYFNLITANTMEERKLKVLNRKKSYEDAIDREIQGQASILATTSIEDLRYMLTG
jgi:hypothetical protein